MSSAPDRARSLVTPAPFGFDVAKSPYDYQCEEGRNYWYGCRKAPRPSAELDSYSVQYVHGVGACKIRGQGPPIVESGNGFYTRQAVDRVRDEIAREYGSHTHTDESLGRRRTHSDNWLEEIHQRKRGYVYIWHLTHKQRDFGDLKVITVYADAPGATAGYVVAEFHTQNLSRCEEVMATHGSEVIENTGGWKAQPFGFEIDANPEDDRACMKIQEYTEDDWDWYRCLTAPRPHPTFAFYVIRHAKGEGTCMISGRSHTIDDSWDGADTRDVVHRLRDQISKRYGRATQHIDKILGPPETKSEAWLKGIREKNRIYAYFWDAKPESEAFGDIKLIAAFAQAVNAATGFVTVEFHIRTGGRCNAGLEGL